MEMIAILMRKIASSKYRIDENWSYFVVDCFSKFGASFGIKEKPRNW